MVETKHPAEALSACNLGPVVARRVGFDQVVGDPLVVALSVVVLDVLVDGVAKVRLSEQDHSIEAFFLIERMNARRERSFGLSNAPDADGERRRFRVTHPFHPLCEHEFDLINLTNCWGDERIFYVDETDQVRSLPARWTSAVADEPFVVISAGRSHFRIAANKSRIVRTYGDCGEVKGCRTH